MWCTGECDEIVVILTLCPILVMRYSFSAPCISRWDTRIDPIRTVIHRAEVHIRVIMEVCRHTRHKDGCSARGLSGQCSVNIPARKLITCLLALCFQSYLSNIESSLEMSSSITLMLLAMSCSNTLIAVLRAAALLLWLDSRILIFWK